MSCDGRSGWALITGASSGIGSDFARVFAGEGYPLILVARSQDRLEALAEELKKEHSVEVRALPCDLSEAGAAKKLSRTLASKGLDVEVLVNNAGFGMMGSFIGLDAERQGEMVRLNVLTLTELTRSLVPAMVARGKGKVLNVASTAAFQPGPWMAVYFATKSYVLSFSVALKEELVGTGVDVTCLCPGPTDTRFASTAQAGDTPLFRMRKPLTSLEVAKEGYRALQKGEAVHVTGTLNRVVAFAVRFVPLRMAAKIAKRITGKSER